MPITEVNPPVHVEQMITVAELTITIRTITYQNGEQKHYIILRDRKNADVKNILQIDRVAPVDIKDWHNILLATPEKYNKKSVN